MMKEVAYATVSTTDDDACVSKPRPQAANDEQPGLMWLALLVNFVLLFAVVVAVGVVYYDIETKVQKIDVLINVIASPAELPRGLVRGLSAVMGASVNTFFFGDADGTIAQFIQNTLLYDFGALGASVSQFGNAMTSAFIDRENKECYLPVVCPSWGTLLCPSGSEVYCEYGGQTVDCARTSCITPNIRSAASLAASIGAALQQWNRLGNNATSASAAAFSNGIFQLDLVLEWARRQFDDGAKMEWSAAAAQCQTFATQMKAIQWSGTYTSAHGNTDSWSANSDVRQVMDYALQVCNDLAQLQ